MRLVCPTCGTAVAAEDMNLERAMARCRKCNEVFGFAGQVAGSREPYLGRALPRAEVPLPKRFRIEDGSPFRIIHRWFGPKAFLFVFFTVFWDGVVAVFVAGIIKGAIPLPVLAFISLHLAVGVGVAYYTLALFINRTAVEVDGDRLRVTHGPLPWPGNRDLGTGELQQLWSRERISRSKNGTSVTYEVHAALKSGSVVQLLTGLDAPEQALFVEQQLESRLGIRDAPVEGELAR